MKNEIDLKRRIIVALDVEKSEEAISLVKKLDEVEVFKVGLRLFILDGPPLIKEIQRLGKRVFLDLKFHDIPNTVSDAIRASLRHGAFMITLHASGGSEMMKRAREAAEDEAEKQKVARPLLLAVTVLTSLRDKELKEIGIEKGVISEVENLAQIAAESGMDGVVCSPQEIEIIKKNYGDSLLLVVPGIRPAWAEAQDQKRIMTPGLAFQKGADYLVIGRPIIKHPSPEEAYRKILKELNGMHRSAYGKDST